MDIQQVCFHQYIHPDKYLTLGPIEIFRMVSQFKVVMEVVENFLSSCTGSRSYRQQDTASGEYGAGVFRGTRLEGYYLRGIIMHSILDINLFAFPFQIPAFSLLQKVLKLEKEKEGLQKELDSIIKMENTYHTRKTVLAEKERNLKVVEDSLPKVCAWHGGAEDYCSYISCRGIQIMYEYDIIPLFSL